MAEKYSVVVSRWSVSNLVEFYQVEQFTTAAAWERFAMVVCYFHYFFFLGIVFRWCRDASVPHSATPRRLLALTVWPLHNFADLTTGSENSHSRLSHAYSLPYVRSMLYACHVRFIVFVIHFYSGYCIMFKQLRFYVIEEDIYLIFHVIPERAPIAFSKKLVTVSRFVD